MHCQLEALERKRERKSVIEQTEERGPTREEKNKGVEVISKPGFWEFNKEEVEHLWLFRPPLAD